MIKLGVNIDHVATLRQARGTKYPDPLLAAIICGKAGCDSIVAHLREDRRHIQERDIKLIKETIKIPFNLEMAAAKEIVEFALKIKPHQATLVPEKRQELTTEGGLNMKKDFKKIETAVKKLQDFGITVSLFINPDQESVELSKKIGANNVEFNTGRFCEVASAGKIKLELEKIRRASYLAKELGFFVAAGHGIDYQNVKKIIKVKEIEELNIGHSIICRALYFGLKIAVEEMVGLLNTDNRF